MRLRRNGQCMVLATNNLCYHFIVKNANRPRNIEMAFISVVLSQLAMIVGSPSINVTLCHSDGVFTSTRNILDLLVT